ncbi:hypothetical protein T484DRAFT_1791135 [Baffinella frigidus]|nr:hypothetical protein T484DRAFT_1791135 [Cryptophyta sp. CCMP2293]
MTALPLTVAEAVSFRTELEKGPDVALARDILRTLSERAADWGVVNKSKIWVTVKLLRASKDKDVVELAAAVTKQWKAVAMKFQKEVEEKKKKKKEDKRKKLQEYEETKLKEEAEADEMKTKLKRALALVDGKVNYPYWNKGGMTPLHHASWKGNWPLVKQLLAAGVDKDGSSAEDGETPLKLASFLVSRGFKNDGEDAAEGARDRVVEVLRRAGARE